MIIAHSKIHRDFHLLSKEDAINHNCATVFSTPNMLDILFAVMNALENQFNKIPVLKVLISQWNVILNY